MELKYVVFDRFIPVIFPANLTHSDMAQAFPAHPVTSAGFVNLSDLKPFGLSQSLGIGPAEDDQRTLRRFYGGKA